MYGKKQVFIAFGSNLPGTDGSSSSSVCKQALQILKEVPGLTFEAVSSDYYSLAVPNANLPPYINNVALFTVTGLSSSAILTVLLAIENQFGRVRTFPNAPRILDLDLIAYGEELCHTDFLTLPHPRMHERPFVLMPMADLRPNWWHPIYQKTVKELLEELNFFYESCYRLS